MSDVQAGSAYVIIAARDQLTKQLATLEAKFDGFGKSAGAIGRRLAGAGLVIGAGFAYATKQFVDTGSKLTDLSAQTGVSTESLSAMGYAAKQVGLDLQVIGTSVKNMQRTLYEAETGGKEANETLSALGVTLESLKGLTPEQKLQTFIGAIGSISDETTRSALAMKIFGKAGNQMLALTEDGGAAFAKLQKKARDLGLVMSAEDAAAADDLGDALDTLAGAVQRVTNEVGSALTPTITHATEQILPTVKAVGEWAKANKPLIASAAGVTAGAIGLGSAMTLLEPTISAVGAVIGAVATPLGAVITLAGGASAAFLLLTENGRSLAGNLQSSLVAGLNEAEAQLTGSLDTIADSLKNGQVNQAAELMFANLELTFAKGWARLKATSHEAAVGTAAGFVLDVVEWFDATNRQIEDSLGFRRRMDNTAGFAAVRQSLQEMNAAEMASVGAEATRSPEILKMEARVEDLRRKAQAVNREIAANAPAADAQPRNAANDAWLQNSVNMMSGRFGVDLDKMRETADTIKGAFSSLTESREFKQFAFGFAEKRGKDAGQYTFESIATGVGAMLGNVSNEAARPIERIFEGAVDALGQFASGMGGKDPRESTIGTFSGIVAEQLHGAENVQERTAKAAEDTAKATKRLADAAERGEGLVFG